MKEIKKNFMSKKSNNYIKGFTMLELGVAMMCMAILATLFLFGKDIINATKLNKEISELASFKSSFSGFAEKYNCLPGDCRRASDFMDCTDFYNKNGGLACNGDGNGRYDSWGWNSDTWRYWVQQEALGFLKTGSYRDNTPGNRMFRSSGYSAQSAHIAIFGNMYSKGFGASPGIAIPNVNVILFTASYPGAVDGFGPVLNPINAESLDRKMDDGSPNTGAITGYAAETVVPSMPSGDCLSGTNYNVANDAIACFITMRLSD
jgi:Tfp pilus assembly protein FimT